jgi:hypothetical protein
MESIVNPIAVALLLTSLYVLRFRGWTRPGVAVAYFASFATLEVVATHWLIPPGAFGPALGYVCLGLTVPAVIAIVLVRRHERYERDEPIGGSSGRLACAETRSDEGVVPR